MSSKTYVFIGGGAAGFFGAIRCAEVHPNAKVILLEKTRQLLTKVRISGGGRCNVTHACFDPSLLVNNYPRGKNELRGPFTRFQPKDTIAWFESRGVKIKTEEDGRMFPITDSSETIINCLMAEAKQKGVEIRLGSKVEKIEKGFKIHLREEEDINCDAILLASGSSPEGHNLAANLGHSIEKPVPSLFTFNIPQSPLEALSGISVEKARVTLPEAQLTQEGPLLITHWGFSGPAVLKLSAWGARILHELNYKTEVLINWLPQYSREQLFEKLKEQKEQNPKKQIVLDSPFAIPRNLWKTFVIQSNINLDLQWTHISKVQMQCLIDRIYVDKYQIDGRTTYKQEFVTCGGVKLNEVNFKTMESKITPGLFFAGEILDIDGVTGGFNFQAAWTTSWIAGSSMI